MSKQRNQCLLSHRMKSCFLMLSKKPSHISKQRNRKKWRFLSLLKNTVLFCLLGLHSTLFSGWLERKAEGWAWYENPEAEVKEKRMSKSPLETLADSKRKVEEMLAKALLEPTSENVMAYMKEQRKWMEQSSKFAATWAHVLLQDPTLDNTVMHPVSHYGIQIDKSKQQEQKEKRIHSLAKEHGLFFFYRGGDIASKAFAQVILDFTKKYQWALVPITVDGIFLTELPTSKIDNSMTKKIGIDVYPSLYVVNPKTDLIVPVSFGLVSMDQIETNIALQFEDYE